MLLKPLTSRPGDLGNIIFVVVYGFPIIKKQYYQVSAWLNIRLIRIGHIQALGGFELSDPKWLETREKIFI
jgi:hypothetical protein